MPHSITCATQPLILGTACLSIALPFAQTQAQSAYPTQPIRMIIALAAGSAVDSDARIVTQKMSQNVGQSIVIENIAGAAGAIGADRVAKSARDGYTLGGFNDSIMTMLPNLQRKMGGDIVDSSSTRGLP